MPVGVEKLCDRSDLFSLSVYLLRVLLSSQLSGGWQGRGCRLSEKAHQSLDVLRSRLR